MNQVSQEIIKDAGILLTSLNKGELNIPRVKALLAKVSSLGSPAAKKKRESRVDKYLSRT